MRRLRVNLPVVLVALLLASCNADGTGLAAQWQCRVIDSKGNIYQSSAFQAVAAMSTASADCSEAALDPTSCTPQGCAEIR